MPRAAPGTNRAQALTSSHERSNAAERAHDRAPGAVCRGVPASGQCPMGCPGWRGRQTSLASRALWPAVPAHGRSSSTAASTCCHCQGENGGVGGEHVQHKEWVSRRGRSCHRCRMELRTRYLAVGETVILMTPPLHKGRGGCSRMTVSPTADGTSAARCKVCDRRIRSKGRDDLRAPEL